MTELINSAGDIWAEYFGLALLQNTLFLGIVFLMLAVFRKAPARVRYLIGLTGIIKLLLPPFLPFRTMSTAVELSRGTSGFITLSGIREGAVPLSGAADAGGGVGITGILFLTWIFIAAGYFAWSAFTTVRLSRVLGRAVPAGAVQSFSPRAGENIEIFISGEINMPMSLAVFPGRIFVPASWWSLDDKCRRLVLEHEIAHMRRHDGLGRALQILVQALYFFHPLVLILCRKMREYMEMACDDASIGLNRSSSVEYSRYLVEIAEMVVRNPLACESASALIRQKNELLSRVTYQLRGGKMQRISRIGTMAVLVSMILMILPFSWYRSEATSAVGDYPGEAGSQAEAGNVSRLEKQEKTGLKHVTVRIPRDMTGEEIRKQLDDKMEGIDDTEMDMVVATLVIDREVSMETVLLLQKILIERNLLKVKFFDDEGNGMPLMLPPDSADRRWTIAEENMKYILVTSTGDIYLDDSEIDIEKLIGRLNDLMAENNKLVISINSEPATTYDDFRDVLKKIKQSEIKRIVIKVPED